MERVGMRNKSAQVRCRVGHIPLASDPVLGLFFLRIIINFGLNKREQRGRREKRKDSGDVVEFGANTVDVAEMNMVWVRSKGRHL